ncbi:MAG: beta-lactamase domain protein [Actinomycetia bacterium]|nr:beta-lactamase domain protein [Actinomycetes bacterium]
MIIDPGQDAERGIEELLARYRLKPIAVLLTHGHLDHIWSVGPVCGAKGIPAYIHPDDRVLLSDPGKGLSLMSSQQLFGGMTFTEPDDVRELGDNAAFTLAGVPFTVSHVPGHTEGSVTFRTTEGADEGAPTPNDPAELDVLFSGDLLFAGSIGRTDLPGGDHRKMMGSLAKTLTLPDATVVLPGHGPQTTIGAERDANPFLTGLERPAQKGL